MRSSLTCLALACLPVALAADESRTLTVGPEYRKGGAHRFWFGDGYRDLWTTPVELPVLDLQAEAGGLTPVRQVGGYQTPGLALQGKDGRSYTFRSLDKDPSRILPAEWRNTATAKLFKDQIAASHPAAEVVYSSLARSLGILFPESRLVLMPDAPELGAFRATFANKPGTFFQYPTAGFEGALELITSQELYAKWLADPGTRADARAYLKARMLDIVLGNWDRHRNQWHWARLADAAAWQPVPEDPDQCFSRYEGAALGLARSADPRFLRYDAEYPGRIEGLLYNGADMNRWLLGGVEWPVYEEVARELVAGLSDDVIAQAVARMPPEWQAKNAATLTAEIRSRRDALPAFARRFYERLAGSVDVRAGRSDDVASVHRREDGALELALTTAAAPEPLFRRTFLPNETREVHLYLYAGSDRIVATGRPSGPIELHVVKEGGTLAGADAPGVRLAKPWKNPAPLPDGVWVEPRSDGHWTAPMALLWWEPDIEVLFGAGFSRTAWGFRRYPWASLHAATISYSTGEKKLKGQYSGQYRLNDESLLFRTDVLASGIEHVNYFGLGNETPNSDKALSRTRQDLASVFPSLRFGSSRSFEAFLGPEARWVKSSADSDTILNQQQPLGSGEFGELLVRGGFELDSRGRQTPLTGMHLAPISAGQPRVPTSGVRMKAEGFYAPAAWDVESGFGGAGGSVAGYLGSQRAILALRVGGAKVWGDYPWFEASDLGGSANLRGFSNRRFTGDASVYVNSELRFWLGTRRTPILPLRWGLFAFYDTGRVWLAGEDSDTWHYGWGGGLLMQLIGMPLTFNAALAVGDEGDIKFYMKYGYSF